MFFVWLYWYCCWSVCSCVVWWCHTGYVCGCNASWSFSVQERNYPFCGYTVCISQFAKDFNYFSSFTVFFFLKLMVAHVRNFLTFYIRSVWSFSIVITGAYHYFSCPNWIHSVFFLFRVHCLLVGGLIWLWVAIGGGLLWVQLWTFRFH